jgi:hypothetical protein
VGYQGEEREKKEEERSADLSGGVALLATQGYNLGPPGLIGNAREKRLEETIPTPKDFVLQSFTRHTFLRTHF